MWETVTNLSVRRGSAIDTTAHFTILKKTFIANGVLFPSRDKGMELLRVFLDVTNNLYMLYVLCATVNETLTTPGTSFIFASMSTTFLAVCIRLAILYKRKDLSATGDMIERLSQRCHLVPSKKNKKGEGFKQDRKIRRYLITGCCFSYVCPVLLMVTAGTSAIIQDSVERYVAYYLFGAKISAKKWWYFTFVVIAHVTEVLVCKVLPFLSLVTCCYTYYMLKLVNENFTSRLETSVKTTALSTIFEDYAVFHNEMTAAIQQVEKSLSLIAFLIYGYLLSSIFSVTSYLVTTPTDQHYIYGVLHQALAFVVTVFSFLLLSIMASGVEESSAEIKYAVHQIPSRIEDVNPYVMTTMLQMANHFSGEVCATGWGLFYVTRSFILTTAGVVVTYGVILAQIGK